MSQFFHVNAIKKKIKKIIKSNIPVKGIEIRKSERKLYDTFETNKVHISEKYGL